MPSVQQEVGGARRRWREEAATEDGAGAEDHAHFAGQLDHRDHAGSGPASGETAQSHSRQGQRSRGQDAATALQADKHRKSR